MKDLHPNEDEVQHKIYRGLFPPNTNTLTQLIESHDFQQLIATDATTKDGQQKVAEYFHVSEKWAAMKETNSFQAYYELLCLVKTKSPKDSIWISFWEGMHRHAAIIMTLAHSWKKLISGLYQGIY